MKLIGFPEEVVLDQFTGVVLHSSMERTGHFSCSNPLVNQLHHNILWGQKGTLLMFPQIVRSGMNGWDGQGCTDVHKNLCLSDEYSPFYEMASDLRAEGKTGACCFCSGPEKLNL